MPLPTLKIVGDVGDGDYVENTVKEEQADSDGK